VHGYFSDAVGPWIQGYGEDRSAKKCDRRNASVTASL
jgi:hypothetical protein